MLIARHFPRWLLRRDAVPRRACSSHGLEALPLGHARAVKQVSLSTLSQQRQAHSEALSPKQCADALASLEGCDLNFADAQEALGTLTSQVEACQPGSLSVADAGNALRGVGGCGSLPAVRNTVAAVVGRTRWQAEDAVTRDVAAVIAGLVGSLGTSVAFAKCGAVPLLASLVGRACEVASEARLHSDASLAALAWAAREGACLLPPPPGGTPPLPLHAAELRRVYAACVAELATRSPPPVGPRQTAAEVQLRGLVAGALALAQGGASQAAAAAAAPRVLPAAVYLHGVRAAVVVVVTAAPAPSPLAAGAGPPLPLLVNVEVGDELRRPPLPTGLPGRAAALRDAHLLRQGVRAVLRWGGGSSAGSSEEGAEEERAAFEKRLRQAVALTVAAAGGGSAL